MTAIITWALALGGPIVSVVGKWLPGAKLSRAAWALGGLALLATVAFGVWQVREWGEAGRVATRAKELVDTANTKAENNALKSAIAEKKQTLADRDKSLADSAARIEQLETKQKEARDASQNLDAEVVRPDDPWIQRGRVRRSKY